MTAAGSILADKYRLGEVLGRGSMGTVYRASQVQLGRDVAVKVLHREFVDKPGVRARFLREARVAAQLRHPASVQVIDFGEDGGAPYLVMELIEGKSLRAELAGGPLAVPTAIRYARDVASALAAAHEIDLVHRDIKPENILLTVRTVDGRADGRIDGRVDGQPAGTPRARVVDFGLAFIAPRQEGHPELGRLTDEGTLGGTPAYMAPEQVRGRAVGPACDVYALGCTLYELLCGEPPFLGHLAELLTRHTYTAPTPLLERTPAIEVPAALDDLLMQMLSKSPPLRPTAREVAGRLTQMLAADPQAPPQDRASRALRTRSASLPPPLATSDITVAVCGAIDDELELGLVAEGFRVDLSGDVAAADVVLWAEANIDDGRLARTLADKPVVALIPDRIDAILQALRAGVDEAASNTAGSDGVGPLLRRAVRHRGQAPVAEP